MKHNDADYVCITDIAALRNPVEPKDVVKNWMRSRATVSFLGLWEKLHNSGFNRVDFDRLLAMAGDNAFTMSPTRWIEEFHAIGFVCIYASEADVLNVALFGRTHQEWQRENPGLKGNQRDYATINQLICISNMENINAVMINDGIPQPQRLKRLNEIAIHQMRVLSDVGGRQLLK